MTHRLLADHLDLAQIAASGQCFRMVPEGGGFVIRAADRSVHAVSKEGILTLDCREEDLSFWRSYFDLETDYGRFQETVDPSDDYLKKAAAFGSGIRILRQDLWEMIVTFLISQQNNIPRIRKCIENLCREYGRDMGGWHAFPGPEALAGLEEDALMPCNLGYRSKYVVRSARQAVSGEVDLDAVRKMPYPEAKEALRQLFGVGNKVADCICLFALHHLDAFPVDTHIRQVFEARYPQGFPYEKYAGFAGVLQQYIFYYDLMGK